MNEVSSGAFRYPSHWPISLRLHTDVVCVEHESLSGGVVADLKGQYARRTQISGRGLNDPHAIHVHLNGAGSRSIRDDMQIKMYPGVERHQAAGLVPRGAIIAPNLTIGRILPIYGQQPRSRRIEETEDGDIPTRDAFLSQHEIATDG